MSNSLKVSEPSIGMFSEKTAQLPHFLYLAQRDKVLDVSEKVQEGWKRNLSFSFLITVNFPCFIWLSTFIKTSCLPRWMSDTIKAPDRSTCGYRGSGTLGSRLHSLLPQGALCGFAFCWFKARWHGDRWVQTTDIINCNLKPQKMNEEAMLWSVIQAKLQYLQKNMSLGKGERKRERLRQRK